MGQAEVFISAADKQVSDLLKKGFMGGDMMSKIIDITHDILKIGAMDEITMCKMEALCGNDNPKITHRDHRKVTHPRLNSRP